MNGYLSKLIEKIQIYNELARKERDKATLVYIHYRLAVLNTELKKWDGSL